MKHFVNIRDLSTKDLKKIINDAKKSYNKHKKNPATKTFQAIRIFVNNELTEFRNKNEFEYMELKNIGDIHISLNGVKFVDGIDFTFPPLILKPGATTVITSNLKAFKVRYGSEIKVAGVYNGKLNNTGEELKLIDFMGNPILNFAYNDSWYSATDGNGYSAPGTAWAGKETGADTDEVYACLLYTSDAADE